MTRQDVPPAPPLDTDPADPTGVEHLLARLRAHRVVGIIRHRDPEVAEQVARAVLQAGLACVEMTWSVTGAPGIIRRLVAEFGDRYVGAGTIVHPWQVDEVADAGARYVVTPAVRPGVVARCAERAIPTLTGLMTPTELFAAIDLGVRAVKLYPAGTLGPGHLSALRDIAPDISYVPTGGVDAANAGDWLRRGATAVAIGSAFTGAFDRGGEAAVAEVTAKVLAAVGDPGV